MYSRGTAKDLTKASRYCDGIKHIGLPVPKNVNTSLQRKRKWGKRTAIRAKGDRAKKGTREGNREQLTGSSKK